MNLPDKDHDRGTLSIIHGWGFDSQVMAGFAAELSAGWNLQLIDMPGYGKTQPYRLLQDIGQVADCLIPVIPQHSVLAGWSLGGMAAIKIAHGMHDKIRAVILLASTPCFVKKHDWPCGIEPGLIKDMARRISTNAVEVIQEFARLTARGDIFPRETVREIKSLGKMNNTDPRVLQHGLDMLISTDVRKELSELKCPVIMLLGERDRLVTSNTGDAARAILPVLQLKYIKAAGHAPFISKKKETADAINNSVQDHVP